MHSAKKLSEYGVRRQEEGNGMSHPWPARQWENNSLQLMMLRLLKAQDWCVKACLTREMHQVINYSTVVLPVHARVDPLLPVSISSVTLPYL